MNASFMSRQIPLIHFKKYSGRKIIRPVSLREFNHIVVKSKLPVLRLNYRLIQSVLIETRRRFGIRLRAFAIMEDHVHLVVKVDSRKQWADSLRFFTGQVALRLKRGKIWAQRAWSRVVKAGRDYCGAVRYVWSNPFKAGIADLGIDAVFVINGILFGDPKLETGEAQERFSF